MRLSIISIKVLIALLFTSTALAQVKNDIIVINMSGITLIIPQEHESTLQLSAHGSGGTYSIYWNDPVFDSSKYSLEMDQTQLQELNVSGDWVAVDIKPEASVSIYDFRVLVSGKSSGAYEYRLLRDFTLRDLSSSQTKNVTYVEESKATYRWGAEIVAPSRWPSIITAPELNIGGDYDIEFEKRNSFTDVNGRVHKLVANETVEVSYEIVNVETGEKTRDSFEFENKDRVVKMIKDQAPGVYEVRAYVNAYIRFQDAYLELRELGVVTDDDVDDFTDGFTFYDDEPKEIVVLPNLVEGFSGQVDQFGNALISWDAPQSDITYVLESYDESAKKWNVIYSGQRDAYLASNLSIGEKQFQVKACVFDRCNDTVALVVTIDHITPTQCTPFVVDQ